MSEQSSWFGSFLAKLSPRVREKLLSHARAFRYLDGEAIFREGDPSLYLYILKHGRVAIEIHVPSKGRQTILTVGPGDIFSWSALVEPRIETASARAIEEVEVLGIKGGELTDLCLEDSELGFELYRALAEVITARLVATRLQLLDVFATT
ncbi:MAG: cyclic nucleotide-binding domain-containing protein [Acidobacteria bacterium]|nr:cyclic nucleotide-binding domain-containing protein [Acidobacteriota bacterium]MBI3663967.1 cyclic nucleotide-binding domain-containing protein [Acidobacteriota bacterium]